MKFLIFVTLMLQATFAFALRSEKALSVSASGRTWTATLAPGYHFNKKAPNQVQIGERVLTPKSFDPRKIEFESPNGTWDGAQAKLYVCDDEVTFCEVHDLTVSGAKAKSKATAPAKKSAKSSRDKHGFLVNDYAGALELAKKQKKPVMIDFAARWCPGCQRLDAEVFSRKDFATASKDLIKVKLDTDIFENGVLADKYKILGVPTVIFIDAEEREIVRILDYQPPSVFIEAAKQVRKDPTPMAQLVAALGEGDEAKREQLGLRQYLGGQYTDAARTLAPLKNPPFELASARFGAAQEAYRAKAMSASDYEKLLRELLKQETKTLRSLSWRNELIQLAIRSSEKKSVARAGVELADEMLKDPAALAHGIENEILGDMAGYERILVAMIRAELVSNSGADAEEQKKAFCVAADVGDQSRVPTKSLGPSLRYFSLISACERWGHAEMWISELIRNFPDNGDLLRRRLRVLLKLNRFDDAVQVGEASLKDSYGRNEFWVVQMLAEAYKGAGRTKEAHALVSKYLRRPEISFENMKGTKASLEKIRSETELAKTL